MARTNQVLQKYRCELVEWTELGQNRAKKTVPAASAQEAAEKAFDATRAKFVAHVVYVTPPGGGTAQEFRALATAWSLVRFECPVLGPHPFKDQKMQEVSERRALLHEEGGTFDSAQTAKKLRLTRAYLIMATVSDCRYLAVDIGDGLRWPVWQFKGPRPLPGFTQTLDVLRKKSTPFGSYRFFLTPLPALKGRRPLDLLREGDLAPVLKAARTYDEDAA